MRKRDTIGRLQPGTMENEKNYNKQANEKQNRY